MASDSEKNQGQGDAIVSVVNIISSNGKQFKDLSGDEPNWNSIVLTESMGLLAGDPQFISGEIVIPYILKTDGKRHRYYPDLKITYTDGRTALIEIKPKRQTRPPKIKARKGPKYIKEVYAYGMNTSKWEYAKEYAKDRGWVFEIWTEDELKEKGIRIINSSKKYK